MMKMRQKSPGRGLILALILSLVLLAGTAFSMAEEEDRPSAAVFGLDTPAIGEIPGEPKYNDLIANNPAGETGWFAMNTVHELFIADGYGGGNRSKWYTLYDYGESISQATAGNQLFQNKSNNSEKYLFMDTVGFDPNATGRKDHIAVLAYSKDRNQMDLFVLNKSGKQVGSTLRFSSAGDFKHLMEVEAFNYSGFSAITAGDYDGDGKDTLVVYIPEMYKKKNGEGKPNIREVSFAGNKLTETDTLSPNVFSLLGAPSDLNGHLDGVNNSVLRNTPTVHLTSADTDRDKSDELIITAGFNRMSLVKKDVNDRASKVFICDKGSKWHMNMFSTKGMTGHKDGKRLRWATSDVGNLTNASDPDGNLYFPDIITAGWVDKHDGDGNNIIDAIGVCKISCSGAEEVEKDGDTYVTGNYAIQPLTALTAKDETPDTGEGKVRGLSKLSSSGHYESDGCQGLVPVVVFRAGGIKAQESVLIADSVFSYDMAKGLVFEYRHSDFNSLRGADFTNCLVQDAVAGNFDENDQESGKEQVVLTLAKKRLGSNSYVYEIFTYQKNEKGIWKSEKHEKFTNNKPDVFASLCPVDVDKDGRVLKIHSVEREWTDPSVLAILEAPPYFEEYDPGNSETVYGKGKTTGTAGGTTQSFSVSGLAGLSIEAGFAHAGLTVGFEAEFMISAGFTFEYEKTNEVTLSVDYTATDENMVVVYTRPVDVYWYEDQNGGEPFVIKDPGTPYTKLMTVDEYNDIVSANDCNLRELDSDVLAEPGNPFSYRSDVGTEASDVSLFKEKQDYSGQISQSFEYTEGTSKNWTLDIAESFSAKVKLGYVVLGVGAEHAHSYLHGNSESTTLSMGGTVQAPSDKKKEFGFEWRFGHWNIPISETPIDGEIAKAPVLGYCLSKVSAPPSAPEDLAAENVTDTGADIVWKPGRRLAHQYRIYQIFPSGDVIQIGMTDASTNRFHVDDLSPNSTYHFLVRSWCAPSIENTISGESMDSEVLTFSTAPAGVQPITISDPADLNALEGETATTFIAVGLPDGDYTRVTYQWQKKAPKDKEWSNIKNENGSGLTVGPVKKEDNGTQYRCKVSTLYRGALLTDFSKYATLTVGKKQAVPTLTVTNYQGGNGSLAQPYTGLANGRKTIENKKNREVDQEVILKGGNGLPDLSVYKAGDNYYGLKVGEAAEDAEKIYPLTKSGNTYTPDTGNVITATTVPVFEDKNGAGYTDPDILGREDSGVITHVGGNKVYTLRAAVSGDPVSETDTRLKSYSGVTYYWCCAGEEALEYYADVNGKPGTQPVSQPEGNLYAVYQRMSDSDPLILSRSEEWVEEGTGETSEEPEQAGTSGTWFYKITRQKAAEEGKPDTFKIDTFRQTGFDTTYKQNDVPVNFQPASLVVVLEKVQEEYIEYTYESTQGTAITLTAELKDADKKPLKSGVPVQIRIFDTVGGSTQVLEGTTDKNGKVTKTWRAPSAGLYAISAAVNKGKSSSYVSEYTEPQYYDAGADLSEGETEYRLIFQNGDQTLTGTAVYGDSVTPKLQKRTAEGWKDVIGATYTYDANKYDENGKKLDPVKLTGTTLSTPEVDRYVFAAYENEESRAVAVVTVEPAKVRIEPTWTAGTFPKAEGDVTLSMTPNILSSDALKEILTVSCAYFNAGDGAYGNYEVGLAYKNTEGLDPEQIQKIQSFRRNYTASLGKKSFMIAPGSAPVVYGAGENGTLLGRSTDNLVLFRSPGSQIQGTPLWFEATPGSAYEVDRWSINGTEYGEGSTLPEGFSLSKDRKILHLNSFNLKKHLKDGALTVEVSFRQGQNLIVFGVTGGTGGSLKASAGAMNITTGTAVAPGTDLTFKAVPAEGYVVKSWTVDGVMKTRSTGEAYTAGALELKDIRSAHSVFVEFEESSVEYTVTGRTVGLDGTPDATLGAVVLRDADTGRAITGKARKNANITFRANVANEAVNSVQEWRISTDGGNTFRTVEGSGGKREITLYNISRDMILEAIVVSTQKYTLEFEVLNGDDGNKPLTDTNIAKLTAVSNGEALKPGDHQNAYIPADFSLILDPAYRITGWSDNVDVSEKDPANAALEALEEDTKVTVTVAKKPVISVSTNENGNVILTGTRSGEEDAEVPHGGYVDYGTNVTVTLTPQKGYEADVPAGAGWTSVENSDDYTFTIENVTENQTLDIEWKAIPTVQVTWSVIDKQPEDPDKGLDGKLKANVSRKGMAAYEVSADDRGTLTVYRDSEVSFTPEPAEGYKAGKWFVNKTEQRTPPALKIEGNTGSQDVKVQFDPAGEEVTYGIDPETLSGKAKITATYSPRGGRAEDFASGSKPTADGIIDFLLSEVDGGYEMKGWYVDGVEQQNSGGMSFRYPVLANEGADIRAKLQRKAYEVTFSGDNGTVTAEANGGGLTSGAAVTGDTEVTFRAAPKAPNGYVFTGWTVNNSKQSSLEEELKLTITEATKVRASYKLDTVDYEVAFGTVNEGGSLQVKAGSAELKNSPAQVAGGTKLTFTAKPVEDMQVAGWYSDAAGTQQIPGTEAEQTVHTIDSLLGPASVYVKFEPIPTYTITLKKEGEGTVTATVNGKEADISGGSLTVKRHDKVVLTATPAENQYFKGWILNGEQQRSGNTLTLEDVTDNHTAKAAFEASQRVTLKTINGEGGSLTTKVGGETMDASTGITVDRGKKIELTVRPDADKMVKKWIVNDQTTGELSNELTIASISENTVVSVEYEALALHSLPVDGKNFTVKIDRRMPEAPGNERQIRDRGSVTFRAAPLEGRKLKELKLNGGELLAGNLPAGVTVIKNRDGSVTVTVESVTEDLTLTALDEAAQDSGGGFSGGGGKPDEPVLPVEPVHDCPSKPFNDVDTTKWYHEYIDFVILEGLMKGLSQDTFGPDLPITRGMIVTILHRQEGEPVLGMKSPFLDVPEDLWYTDPVIWAEANKIVEGYGNHRFGPDDLITREQMAAILYRYARYKDETVQAAPDFSLEFTDLDQLSTWAEEAMKWCVEQGLINGVGEDRLDPKGTATRAQSAAILQRYCRLIADPNA